MYCALRISVLGPALLCFIPACFAQTPQPASSRPSQAPAVPIFRIAGVVVNAIDGTPLSYARVTLLERRNPRSGRSMILGGPPLTGPRSPLANNPNPRNERWVMTGDDGRFAFENLPPGKYALQGARRGFIASAYDQHGQFSTAIVTGSGIDTENLTLRLPPAAALTGKVVDESGEPVRGAGVELYRENHAYGFSQIAPYQGDVADDLGSFEFSSLPPGVYFLAARAQPWYALHPTTYINSSSNAAALFDPSIDVCYPITFYGGATDADSATPLPLQAGDHLQIDLHLEPVPALHLLLHSPQGEQSPLQVQFEQRVFDSREFVPSQYMSGDSSGNVEITGIPPGKYVVQYQNFKQKQGGQISEINLSRNSDDLDVVAKEQLSSVRIAVKIIEGEQLPPRISVILRNSHLRFMGSQEVDQNGEVHFENLSPDTYALLAIAGDKQYSAVRISYSQGTETSGDSFKLASGASLSIAATFLGGTAEIEGFAKRSGKAAAGAMVVLVPQDPDSNIQLFRRDQSDQDGSFVLRNVIPGAYTVIAIDDAWTMDWSRPTLLARYTPRGQKITITSRSQNPISLPDPVEVQPR